MGLIKNDLNVEVTVVPGLNVLLFVLKDNILELSQDDRMGEVTILVR